MFKATKLLSLVTALQFATCMLIAQRRLPFAAGEEFFIIFSMVLVTASFAKIIDFMPRITDVHTFKDKCIYTGTVVPVYLFIVVVEIWFMYYLFSYDAENDLALQTLKSNRFTLIHTARVLSVINLVLFLFVEVLPALKNIISTRRKKNKGVGATPETELLL